MVLHGIWALALFWIIAKGVLGVVSLVPEARFRSRQLMALGLPATLYGLFSLLMAHQARTYWTEDGQPWGWSEFLLGAAFAYAGAGRPLAGQWWRSSRTVHFLSYYSRSGTADENAVAAHRRYRRYLGGLTPAIGIVYVFFALLPDAAPNGALEPLFHFVRNLSRWEHSWAPLIPLFALGLL